MLKLPESDYIQYQISTNRYKTEEQMLSEGNPFVLKFLLFTEACKYGFVLLRETHTFKKWVLSRIPAVSHERSKFQSTIRDGVYEFGEVHPYFIRERKHLRQAIQEFAHTLENLDLEEIRNKELIEGMNSWFRVIDGEDPIHVDELQVMLVAFNRVQKEHDELKRDFLNPKPKFERATKAGTAPSIEDIAMLLADVRRKTRDMFHISYTQLNTWTDDAIKEFRELRQTPQWRPQVLQERLKSYKKQPTPEERASILEFLKEYRDHYISLIFKCKTLADIDPERCHPNPGEESETEKEWLSIRVLIPAKKKAMQGQLQSVERMFSSVIWSGVLDQREIYPFLARMIGYGLDMGKVQLAKKPSSLNVEEWISDALRTISSSFKR